MPSARDHLSVEKRRQNGQSSQKAILWRSDADSEFEEKAQGRNPNIFR